MIWAYRKENYEEEKKEVEPETLNSLEETMRSITTYSEETLRAEEEKRKEEEERKKKEEEEADPITKVETMSRKNLIQEKNHIKKSAADEYFEKTKNMANDILKPLK